MIGTVFATVHPSLRGGYSERLGYSGKTHINEILRYEFRSNEEEWNRIANTAVFDVLVKAKINAGLVYVTDFYEGSTK